MNKIFTLNKNGDFLALYHRGKSKAHPLLITYTGPRNLGVSKKKKAGKNNAHNSGSSNHLAPRCKVGITASKKIGNAVVRNRARRLIKEAYRLLLPEIVSVHPINIVFIARQGTANASMWQIKKAMRGHLKALGLMAEPDKPACLK